MDLLLGQRIELARSYERDNGLEQRNFNEYNALFSNIGPFTVMEARHA